jgi:2'-5' RNA ligase
VRLFVALWPPPEVTAALEALPRPERPAVRWTAPAQWHVTLRFLGEVAEADLPAVISAVQEVAASQPRRLAAFGPATIRLSRRILAVPVTGVDDLGTAVVDATREQGEPPDERPFSGHLTLGRARGRRPVPAALAGQAVSGPWPVTEIVLVRSHLEPGAVRYETVARAPLAG